VRLLLFLPLVSVMVAVNLRIDPGNVTGTGELERRWAEELHAGHGVRAQSGYDEMLLQRRRAERMRQPPDVLVLGSSRSMTVSSASFPGLRLWNGSVSSATIEDYVAVEQLFEDRGLRPRSVLIGIDPWVLGASLRNNSVALEAELQRGLKRIGLEGAAERGALPPARHARWRYLELLSPAYFQASLSVVASGGWAALRRGRPQSNATPQASSTSGNLIYPDGSLDWAPRLADRSLEETKQLARKHSLHPPAYIMAKPLPERRRLLEAFVSRLRRDGVMVAFWFAPFHPDAYRGPGSSEHTSVIEAAEADFRALAVRLGCTVVGSFDPARAGAFEEDFVDEHHPRRAATLRLLRVGGPSALPALRTKD